MTVANQDASHDRKPSLALVRGSGGRESAAPVSVGSHHVQVRGDRLWVRRAMDEYEVWLCLGIPFVTGAVLFVWVLIAAYVVCNLLFMFVVGLLPVMEGFLATIPLGLVMLALVVPSVGATAWAMRPRWVEVRPEGVRGGGFAVPRIRHATEVRIRGEVGRAIEVTIFGERELELLEVVPSTTGTGWSYDELVWMAYAVAGRLGIEVDDALDHAAWQRWVDPTERNRLEFERRHAESVRRFEQWHQVEPAMPATVALDHHGVSVFDITVDRQELRYRSQRIPLDEIIEVRVAFSARSSWSDSWTAVNLLVRTRDRILRIGGSVATPKVVAGHHWLADRITDQLLLGDNGDAGSIADVPQALVDIGQRARALQPTR